MAVGSYYTKSGNHVPLTESWAGKKWVTVASPSPVVAPPGITYLQGVSCPAASRCLATGAHGNPANMYTLGELWNGLTWRTLSTPNPPAELR
jgi:hypothetical protein